MGLKVYGLVILPSLTLLAVAVDALNDFGEETSGPKGDKLPWFTYETRRLKAIPWDALARERHWNELQSYSKVQ